ncbi:uncharacterized protein LOC110914102 [Helianthus annuus]|uniref:uncharacterized protein LOC110914102 n=1 Tax=Helianthus annuus TaxID=4232 RepID=UPI00165311A7|nr:uncharacterized protein LOC110914102 [Helianthus annuus]
MIEESSLERACYGWIDQDDERLLEGFSWDKWDPNRTSGKVAFVAQIYEDSTAEEELAYAYYQSQQSSPKKIEEEPVATKEASERAPIFDHSPDEKSDDYDSEEIQKLEYYARKFSSDKDNLLFAGKTEKIKEKQAAKKKNHKAATVKEKDDSDDDNSYYAGKMKENKKLQAAKDDSDDENIRVIKKQVKKQDDSDDEDVRVIKKQVKEIPAFKVEKEADAEKIPEKCENCDTSSSEQALAIETLNGAFMTKQKIINNYIEKCAVLEQKLETQRIETERVNRIYPTVEGMKAFEEEDTEVKDTEIVQAKAARFRLLRICRFEPRSRSCYYGEPGNSPEPMKAAKREQRLS